MTTLLLLLACNEYELAPSTDAVAGESCATLMADPYAVDSEQDCLTSPTVGSFDPVIEWNWSENPVFPEYKQIMSTPAIANLTDDNGDGTIDEHDIPDVVYSSFSGSAYGSAGTLSAISGDGWEFHWSVADLGGYPIYSSASPAIGDLDGDGVPEICTAGTTAAVVCADLSTGTPTLKWAAGTELNAYGAPSIADMDGDGLAEVIYGRQIFDHQGNLVGLGSSGAGQSMSFAVDMDGDGQLEVVAGNQVYERDGTALWDGTLPDGISAVGDFDGDGVPEVVTVSGGVVRLISNGGLEIWATALPGGGSGGPPTVADFDGDGAPEVGVAGQAYYTLFNTDGAVLWSNPVSDYSSSVTGSSVFDFEADGSAEVVYADEHTLWIFDGKTGTTLMQQEGHASGTLYEFPLIADVDNDGSTEIIVASNNYAYTGWNGITVIGDSQSSWAPARPIWNQFAYHITNVNNDGSIPAVQVENWQSWNSFRAGGTETGPSNWLPDLRVGEQQQCLTECAAGEVSVIVAVENAGLSDASAVEITLSVTRNGAEAILHTLSLSVPAGEAAYTEPATISREEWGDGGLWAEVNASGALLECETDNNRRSLGEWPCD